MRVKYISVLCYCHLNNQNQEIAGIFGFGISFTVILVMCIIVISLIVKFSRYIFGFPATLEGSLPLKNWLLSPKTIFSE